MKSVPGVACKISKTCVANEQISRNGGTSRKAAVIGRKTAHIEGETQPEHAPRVKSSQRSILLIYELSIIRSFVEVSFRFICLPSILSWPYFFDQAAQFFGLARCRKSNAPLSGADAQLPLLGPQEMLRGDAINALSLLSDPPTVP
jgi:hypothetical protein